MQRINIMYIVHSLGIGGLEKFTVDLVNNVNPHLFKTFICCLTNSGPSASKLLRDVKIFELHKREGNDLFLPVQISKILRQERIKIVHSANWPTYCETVIAAKIARVPVIIHIEHGKEYEDMHQTSAEAWRRSSAFRFLSPWVDRIGAVSLDLRESIINTTGVRSDKITCIPTSVPLHNDKIDKAKIKRQLCLDERTLVIGSVGRLAKVKNYPCLIEAVSLIKARIRNVKTIIIGDGPEMVSLQKLAAERGVQDDVIFLGQRMDVRELLGIMDLFVLPSVFEGTSISILEAMSSRLPVVVTAVGGNPDLVLDGQTGYLVPPTEPEELASRAVKLLLNSELRQAFGIAARKRVEARYSLDAMVKKYERLYISCLNRKRKICH